MHADHGPGKLLSHAQLLRLRAEARGSGRRLVQCHGCFDIVHPGHVRHLRFAKAQGDLLLVSITGDAEIAKGTGRPLIPEELRAENLAALDFVDWVYVEPRPTAAELLEEVRPDVYVKGREYESNTDPRFAEERATVERHGGRVVFSSGDVVFSSTALIRAMEASVDPFHARLTELHAREELSGEALFPLIASIRGKRVVIVGETILDSYILCDRPEVAGESPVMTLRPLERRRYDGGAAVLARHAAALGARPVLVTAMPADAEAAALRQRLLAEGVELRPIAQRHPLAEKQRFLVGAQKVMKVDLVEQAGVDAGRTDALLAEAERAASESPTDAAIVADFGLGLISGAVVTHLCERLRPHVRVLAGDVSGRRSSLSHMRGADLICPSEAELREAAGEFGEGLPAVVWKMLERTRSGGAIVTMGADGLIGFERLPEAEHSAGWTRRLRGEHVPALTPHAVDALGCGDAVLTVATLATASGASLTQASYLGAIGASIEAMRVGNIPVGASDLRGALARLQAAHLAFAPPEVVRASQSVEGRPLPDATPAA